MGGFFRCERMGTGIEERCLDPSVGRSGEPNSELLLFKEKSQHYVKMGKAERFKAFSLHD